jgi:hypothetical protein
LIAYHSKTRSVFLFGFAKSQRDNVSDEDLGDLKKLADVFLALDDDELKLAIDEKELVEVPHEAEDKR